MAKPRDLTPWQKLLELVPEQKAYFIRWYLDDESTREKFDDYSKKNIGGKTLDLCMSWLMDNNVQKGIKFWMGLIEQVNMIKLYKEMYKKALGGSTDAANWIVKFKDSGYFNDTESEISLLLKGVDIPKDDEE